MLAAKCFLVSGSWPMSRFWCVFYQTCDVLACSVSILHLMFISIGKAKEVNKELSTTSNADGKGNLYIYVHAEPNAVYNTSFVSAVTY